MQNAFLYITVVLISLHCHNCRNHSTNQHKMDKTTSELGLPGFRFHPTEEELLDFYLRKMVLGRKQCLNIIGFLNIYHHEPWDLPGNFILLFLRIFSFPLFLFLLQIKSIHIDLISGLSKIGEREWYFFVPRDRKNGHGGRPNRTTEKGFWKATGSDRLIRCLRDPKKILGLRKTLVFYKGRAPRGSKTDWIMNEYRLPNTSSSSPKVLSLTEFSITIFRNGNN